MKLYHGSNVPVNVPDLKHSKPYKDFGKGLYYQSPGYVYSFLQNELNTAKVI